MSDDIDVTPGQTWELDESRADDPDHHWPDNPFGAAYPRFRAQVDAVAADLVVLVVTTRNRHVASPEPLAEVTASALTLREDPRWRCLS